MDETARNLSYALDGVSKAITEWTVSEHEQRDPTLPDRYGARWRKGWTEEVHARLAYLAQSVAVRRPEMFKHAVRWSATAFGAREIEHVDLVTSLRCMRQVLETEVPPALNGPALEYVDVAIAALDGAPSEPPAFIGLDRPHGKLVLRYLEAILAGDRRSAEEMIIEAAEGGLSVADTYLQVFMPALAELGRMWHLNEVTVADEHFAMATTETIMGRLRAYIDFAPRNGHCVVATSISGELHALGIRMVADFFEMAGWQTVLLGANMPSHDVIQSMLHQGANLLAVSITSPMHLRTLGELIDDIRAVDALFAVPIIVGGEPFRLLPDLCDELAADGTAGSALEAVAIGETLVAGA